MSFFVALLVRLIEAFRPVWAGPKNGERSEPLIREGEPTCSGEPRRGAPAAGRNGG